MANRVHNTPRWAESRCGCLADMQGSAGLTDAKCVSMVLQCIAHMHA